MVNYPNKKDVSKLEKSFHNFANRGMNFEHAVNTSNDYYDEVKRAIITKRPTPIHVVKVDYADNARIKDAYFEKQSTADYNGVYRSRYIDFECKETKSKTSLSFGNISSHQIKHLEKVIFHGGIAFFLIHFATLGEVYLLDAKIVCDFYNKQERKSIPYNFIQEKGVLVEQSFMPRLKYLDAVDKVFFNEAQKVDL